MNFKKIISPIIVGLLLFLSMQQVLAAPKDDIFSRYNDDGTFSGYSLYGGNKASGMLSLTIHKYFTSSGVKYTISHYASWIGPPTILRGEILIDNKTYSLKKIFIPYVGIPSEFSYLYENNYSNKDQLLFEVPENIISKIIETPNDMQIFLVVQGRQIDIIYHLPFDKELINALPLLAQTTVEDEGKFKVVENGRTSVVKGSGDPNNPKIIIQKP